MRISKYHALANDYIVLDPDDGWDLPTAGTIQRICDRHTGAGSDGILFGPLPVEDENAAGLFPVRIFNPDGSVAEKSGNGLRIFARYLWDRQLVNDQTFTILPLGGAVVAQVAADGLSARLDLGEVTFDSLKIPVLGPARLVLDERMTVGGVEVRYCAASLGNPHCVVLCDTPPTAELARSLGALVECEARFPRRTNVQFLWVRDWQNLELQIWERGAGYTLASGTSSAAATAAAFQLGLCQPQVTVHMPGGQLQVHIDERFHATIEGPVARVYQADLDPQVYQYRDILHKKSG